MSRKLLTVFFGLVLVIVFLGFSQYLYSTRYKPFSDGKVFRLFERNFHDRQVQAEGFILEIGELFRDRGEVWMDDGLLLTTFHQKFYQDRQIVVVSHSNQIVYWSHNALPVTIENLPSESRGMVQMDNGWYYYIQNSFGDYQTWVFLLIKSEYNFRNQFLPESFDPSFHFKGNFAISTNPAYGFPVYDDSGNYVFSLYAQQDSDLLYFSVYRYGFSIVFAALALILLLVLSFHSFTIFRKIGLPAYGLLFAFGLLLLFRLLFQYFRFPAVFYEGTLFSAGLYATSLWLPSLGDLLLSVVFFCFPTWILFRYRFIFGNWTLSNSVLKYAVAIVLLCVTFYFAYNIIVLLEGLVIHSHLHLNVNFILYLDVFSFIGFLIIGLLFFSFYFLGSVLIGFLFQIFPDRRNFSLLLLLFFIPVSVLGFSLGFTFFWLSLGLLATLLLFAPKNQQSEYYLSLTHLILSFFLFSLLSTYALYQFNHEKENGKRKNFTLRLATEQDPIAEYLFQELEPRLFNDVQLKTIVRRNPYDYNLILDYLRTHYFHDFWAKYYIQITVCERGDLLEVKPYNQEVDCQRFFQTYIDNYGKPGLSPGFIYLDNHTGNNSYISVIPLFFPNEQNPRRIIYLYLEFESRFLPRETGLPELLVDEGIDIAKDFSNYSYAIYKDKELVSKNGQFFYSIRSDVYPNEHEFSFFEKDGYSHLIYNHDAQTQIIVSRPTDTFLEKIAPFSYLFVLFALISFILWIAPRLRQRGIDFRFTFKKRLQFVMIGIVLISVITIGGASVWFIINIYSNKNFAFIDEKAHSVLIEMENQLADEMQLDISYSAFLNDLLLQFSNVFFTDINLYEPGGKLIASSRPKVYEEGLISIYINPIALYELRDGRKSLYTHNEEIGKLEFVSVYVPLRNRRNELIGYINLPYFTKHSELQNEIAYFLVAFVNIYLLLLVLAIVLALFISSFVTRPLQIIRDHMAQLRFGKSNAKIEWNREDEIGNMIGEYNRMIDELDANVQLLARSERESAWRDMAKQVAHEIKNPLTPMRLSVQYLQRAWKDKAPDWDERLDRFTHTMVEQIDNLSVIASEFSDFAKMPVGNHENIHLQTFMPTVMGLYKDLEHVHIELTSASEYEDIWLQVDPKQLLRVFNNLIRNSVQAYDRHQQANIIIRIEKELRYCKIQIQDFGKGISENQRDSIFTPYFTTKSGGMGLGLSMVKSIVEGFNGHIFFDSRLGEGTTFTIRIPLKNQE